MNNPEQRDITKHVPKSRGPVYLTAAAEAALTDLLQSNGSGPVTDTTLQVLGQSLQQFLVCDYMRQSVWFKSQKAHTFVGIQLLDPETKNATAALRMAVKQAPGATLVCAPSEAELPDDYYDTRVVEETKVLYKDFLK